MDVSQLPLNQIEATASNVRNLCYVIQDVLPGHDGNRSLRPNSFVGQALQP
jgi:hypothetical protein